MKRLSILTTLICLIQNLPASNCFENTLTQVATIDGLLQGAYDGVMPCSELTQYGDMGIGTFDHLDGEMVVLNGVIYQVRADGSIHIIESELKTPFAAVCAFDVAQLIEVPKGAGMQATQALIDERLFDQNTFCAVKITGTFRRMKTRSVPPQEKPYPVLTEVVKHQTVFEFESIQGTIVGFRCPEFVKGVNVPGYHLHFLSSDLSSGGHVLDFEITEAKVEIDPLERFYLILPTGLANHQNLDFSKDRSADLQQVEQ
jgi:acetolactate decarboxylase